MKLFQSSNRTLGALITAIAAHESGTGFLISTEAESVQVNADWMSTNLPQVGGYVVIDGAGFASYMTAAQLEAGFVQVGEVDLSAPVEGPDVPALPPAKVQNPHAKPYSASGRRKAKKGRK